MGAPVILCGKTEEIGRGVIAHLKPEYDVIDFITNRDIGVSQIPAVMRGEQLLPSVSALGSKDYSRPPIAVIFGGGYSDTDFEAMMQASAGIKPVPWLRPDMTKPTPPPGPEYGKAMVDRVKTLMARLEKEGKMAEETVHWF